MVYWIVLASDALQMLLPGVSLSEHDLEPSVSEGRACTQHGSLIWSEPYWLHTMTDTMHLVFVTKLGEN